MEEGHIWLRVVEDVLKEVLNKGKTTLIVCRLKDGFKKKKNGNNIYMSTHVETCTLNLYIHGRSIHI